jgi:hypothetical protein
MIPAGRCGNSELRQLRRWHVRRQRRLAATAKAREPSTPEATEAAMRKKSARHGARWPPVLAGLALVACAPPQHPLTYRLTVTVSDNGRPISGSVVRSEGWVASQVGGDNVALNHETRGEAIVLPIRGRLLVVTLGGWDKPRCTGPRDPQGCLKRGDWTPQATKAEIVGAHETWSWKAAPGADGRANLAVDQLPILVTFDGPPSLANVKVVDAAHLDAVFGVGVRLESAVVQPTNEGVSRGVAAALPFVAHPPSGLQSCILADPPAHLSPGEQVKNPDLGDCVTASLFTE